MRVAIVHEWFEHVAGSEKVVAELLGMYPNACLFSLVDIMSDEDRADWFYGRMARTSFIQRLPGSMSGKFRRWLPLFPAAVESLDVSRFDLVISSNHAVAHGVRTFPSQLHVCYCHTPVRYAWDMMDDYLDSAGYSGIKRTLAKAMLMRLRRWDAKTGNRPDAVAANSAFVADRVKRQWKRDASVVHPPVDTDRFAIVGDKSDYYAAASRMVPYKKLKLIAESFVGTDKKLKIAGDGPDADAVAAIAAEHGNIEYLGAIDNAAMVDLLSNAKGYVFAALEDFGIMPVEAMAAGTPVIALGTGGTAETVIDGITGVHFMEQSTNAIRAAVERFESLSFDPAAIRRHAESFSRKNFRLNMQACIDEALEHRRSAS